MHFFLHLKNFWHTDWPFVGSAGVGIALITREHSVTGSTLSPGCFLGNPLTSVRKATFAYLTTTVFRFFIVTFLAFQTPVAHSERARDRSNDVKVIFVVIQVNLFFSALSFVDNGVKMFGRQNNDLVAVNHCLEFGHFC